MIPFGQSGFKRIWLVGIKGAGMCGLAKLLVERGCNVSGSDLDKEFAFTQELSGLHLHIVTGFSASNIDRELDMVVYSTAWPTAPELDKARQLGVPVISYPEALWSIVGDRRVIAVCGCHGKTTTTGIVGHILVEAGWSPTFLGGAPYPSLRSSAGYGEGRYAVIEADEYQNKFRYYHPFAVVITNLGYDHPDYFVNEQHYFKVFADFVQRVADDGIVVGNADDAKVRRLAGFCKTRFIGYGLEDEKLDWYAKRLDNAAGSVDMKIFQRGREIGRCESKLMGRMNCYNVLAGIVTAVESGVPSDLALQSVAGFDSPKRRLEYIGVSSSGARIWDDFASHPTEVGAVLQALRGRFGTARIIAIIQVHSMARLKLFLAELGNSLLEADSTIVTSTYVPSRETGVQIGGEEDLCQMIRTKGGTARLFRNWDDIYNTVARESHHTDVIITLGGGDIWKLARHLARSSACR
jgi:UDP-N-acetylmuramate--alanine ligase